MMNYGFIYIGTFSKCERCQKIIEPCELDLPELMPK
jgi:hypothetical protein